MANTTRLPPIQLGNSMLAFLIEEQDEGWQERLHCFHLWDCRLSKKNLYLRYKKFHKLDLGVILEEHKWAFF